MTPKPATFKKRKKGVKKGGLSFGDEEDGEMNADAAFNPVTTTRSDTPGQDAIATESGALSHAISGAAAKKGLKPSTGVSHAPKVQTKAALAREAQVKESLRKQYLLMQEAVRATEFILPFVVFDGKDSPGGKVRMRKGDHVWLFLERARKVGAEMAAKSGGIVRKDWARISVDDLMLVRGEIIIPPVSSADRECSFAFGLWSIDFRLQHYDFHHFILNRTVGYHGLLFSLSSEPTPATPSQLLSTTDESTPPRSEPAPATAGLSHPSNPVVVDGDLEGFPDDPAFTKVVDRRWYERNKHIYPASAWEDFDPQRDYSQGGRKDREGNQMFFAR